MENNNTFRKIGAVVLSNVIKLGSSILVSFIIPGILGLTGYGYYKVYILYMTYVGMFHFGFIDGIYLKYGGTDYSELNRPKFRMYTRFILVLELIIALIGIIITIVFIDGEKKFIFTILFINMVANNITTYFQFISQITSRFKEYSIRTIILSITNILVIGYMYLFKSNSYREYLFLIVLMNYLLLLWYINTYKDITFGKKEKTAENKNELIGLFKLGIPLLLANLISTLVLTIDKQIVEIFFDVDTFGIYSFAYSMLSMITVVVSAVGVVLYPTLKKADINKVTENYSILNRVVIIIVMLGLFGYFPLLWIIPKFLPDYIDSLPIFRIALPGLMLSSSVSAIKHNYFKITDNNKTYLIIGIFILLITLGLNLGSYFIFKEIKYITISSIIGIFIWYIITEIYMVKNYKVKWKKNLLLIIFGMLLFYFLTSLSNYIISGSLYLLIIVAFIFITSGNDIKSFIKSRKQL